MEPVRLLYRAAAGRARQSLERCGVELLPSTDGPRVSARSPITGEALLDVPAAGRAEVDTAIAAARAAFTSWRTVPAPVRGALVKRLGALLLEHKAEIAELITIEAGKIASEALGEVQEMIDICDFAVGLSRQLEGRTMPSERPSHRLMETWHPLGVVAVISAINSRRRCGPGTRPLPSSAGTAGQRCTTMRRVIAHEDVVEDLVGNLRDVFGRLPIGDPLAPGTLVGPLINERAYRGIVQALGQARADGGELVVGGRRRLAAGLPDAYYLEPALVRVRPRRRSSVARRSLRSCTSLPTASSRTRSRCTTASRRACRRASLPAISERPSASWPRMARTAGSSTSTSARRGPRSAAPSAVRSPPAAGANRDPTRGPRTCAAPPTRSSIPTSFR
jgi:hypothetical protein